MEWSNPDNSFKTRIESNFGLIFFLLLFSFYVWHGCPSLYRRDPGEFAAFVFNLSLGHLLESPTDSIICKPFTFTPWGSPFQEITFVSALFAAIAVFYHIGWYFFCWLGEESFDQLKSCSLSSALPGAATPFE